MEDPKVILITGGAGFIGSNCLRYLWSRFPETHFHVLDLLTYAGDIRNIDPELAKSKRFSFWYGDVCNNRLVDKLVAESDVVIHFAAETHVARSIYDDVKFFETDVLGTQAIANAVLRHRDRVKRFIHISTSEVYGTARNNAMAEDHPLEPQSPYAAAKAGADRLVYSYILTHKIPAVIIRPFNMYGSHQHLEKLIPRFITSVILNEPLTIHGTGDSQRDFVNVNDFARALELVIRAPREKVEGEVFNVGTGVARSVSDIAGLITKIMKNEMHEKKFTPFALNIGDRPGQVFKHICDFSKINARLGWKPEIPFEDGVRKTIDWYVANRAWWEPKIWMRHVPILTAEGNTEMH